jgi:hypothetical protein
VDEGWLSNGFSLRWSSLRKTEVDFEGVNIVDLLSCVWWDMELGMPLGDGETGRLYV